MAFQPKIYILVPTHNRILLLKSFVSQLKGQTYQNFQVILVDDGSSDGSAQYVKTELPSSVVIRGDGNLWWGGSLHAGYKKIKSLKPQPEDLVLIINDDTHFDSSYLENGRRFLENKGRVLLGSMSYDSISGKISDPGVQWNWETGDFKSVQDVSEINCLSTRGLFLKAKDFLDLGGFHPILLPHYFSDYEYTVRAHNRGFQLLTSPEVKISTDARHAGVTKFDYSNRKNFLSTYLSQKNYQHPQAVLFFFWLSCPSFFYKLRQTRILLMDMRFHFSKVPDMRLEVKALDFLIRSLSLWGWIKKRIRGGGPAPCL